MVSCTHSCIPVCVGKIHAYMWLPACTDFACNNIVSLCHSQYLPSHMSIQCYISNTKGKAAISVRYNYVDTSGGQL